MNDGTTGSSASSSNATTQRDSLTDDLLNIFDEAEAIGKNTAGLADDKYIAHRGALLERLVIYITDRDRRIHENAYKLGKSQKEAATHEAA